MSLRKELESQIEIYVHHNNLNRNKRTHIGRVASAEYSRSKHSIPIINLEYLSF